jgi:flagellar biosynthesis anti-sigma factor FlgM
MANTIDPKGVLPGQVLPADVTQTSRPGQVSTPQAQSNKAAGSDPSPSDDATLSAIGGTLAAAIQKAGAQSGFRAELVAQLKAQISSGTYKIDLQGLAETVARVIGS